MTATQLLAGLCENHFSYSAFISAKLLMSSRNTYIVSVGFPHDAAASDVLFARVIFGVLSDDFTLHLTILLISLPASSKIALMLSAHCRVLSVMLPSISSPFSLAGICPET